MARPDRSWPPWPGPLLRVRGPRTAGRFVRVAERVNSGDGCSLQGGGYRGSVTVLRWLVSLQAPAHCFPSVCFYIYPSQAHQESCLPREAFTDPLQSARTCFVCESMKASGSSHYHGDCWSDSAFAACHVPGSVLRSILLAHCITKPPPRSYAYRAGGVAGAEGG